MYVRTSVYGWVSAWCVIRPGVSIVTDNTNKFIFDVNCPAYTGNQPECE
jgi:hypothetical protein